MPNTTEAVQKKKKKAKQNRSKFNFCGVELNDELQKSLLFRPK